MKKSIFSIKEIYLPLVLFLMIGHSKTYSASDETLKNTESAEIVEIVAYDSGDFKMSGDWALLSDRRNIQIRSNLFRDLLGLPALRIPDEIKNRDLWRLRQEPDSWQKLSGILAKLDLRQGVICVDQACMRLMAICPSLAEVRAGRSCDSFSKN